MARSKTTAASRKPTIETLVALGPQRLAQLILTQADADPLFARAVRMALAAKEDVSSLAHEIEKRLKTIRRSTSFVDWDRVRPLARELDQLRENIVGALAEQSIKLAIDQMQLFLSLAESVYERADDSSGSLGDVFRQGGEDLGGLWVRAGDRDPTKLATEILALIEADGYGVFDGLPAAASSALGKDGRAAMRRLLLERQAALSGDQRRRYDYTANWLLPALADLDDDVDAFIATVDPDRGNASRNADVAKRLIAHDRAAEALEWIDAPTERGYNERELADLRLKALETLGRKEDAQAQRRQIFERWLDSEALRAWLKALPAFEDFEAECQALDFVMAHPDAELALDLLIAWPDLARAAKLAFDRLDQLEGRRYDVLRPASAALEAGHPGAATLLYRRLVSSVVDRGSSKYYPYAARDYHSAAALADAIGSEAGIPTHVDWTAELRRQHGRKIGFWSLVEGSVSRGM